MEREENIRTYPFTVTRSEDTGDGLTLEGYAVVFEQPTRIESTRGPFLETMKRGAFSKTLREKTPVLMFDHGQHPVIGPMPIGAIEDAHEDAHGVYIRARLADNWLTQPVRDAIQLGAVSGMSFRMSNIKETVRNGKTPGDLQERDVTEVRCPELGPVVFPAYETTSVSVRSMAEALTDEDARNDLVQALWMAADERADTAPYGDVAYADPGYKTDKVKRYPINTAQHAKTAWAYINMPKNQADYTPAQVTSIKSRIKAALKRFGITVSVSSNTNSADIEGDPRDLAGWTMGDLMPVLCDAIEDQLYENLPDAMVCVCDFTDRTAYYSVFHDGVMELYEVDFTVDDAGAVTLGSPVEVVKKTTYIPATSDEAAEGTSDEAGGTSEPPRHSPPTFDAEMRRLDRRLKAQHQGAI